MSKTQDKSHISLTSINDREIHTPLSLGIFIVPCRTNAQSAQRVRIRIRPLSGSVKKDMANGTNVFLWR